MDTREQKVFVSPQVLSGPARLRVDGLVTRLVQADEEVAAFWLDRCRVLNGPTWHWRGHSEGKYCLRDSWFATVLEAQPVGPFRYRMEHEGITYELDRSASAEWVIREGATDLCEVWPATGEVNAAAVPVVVACLSLMIILPLHRDAMAASATYLRGRPSVLRWRQEVLVPALPEIVFGYVADFTHLPEWCNMRLTGHPPDALAAGTRLTVESGPFEATSDRPPRASGELTLTLFVPVKRLGWTVDLRGPARSLRTWSAATFDFSAVPDGTRIEMTTEIPLSPPMGLRRIHEGYFQIEAGDQLHRIKRALQSIR